MSEKKEELNTLDPVTPTDPKKEEPKGGEPTAFTQDQVNEIVSKKVNDLNEKFDKKLSETLKKERDDWERQAKLSEEEKQKELSAKQAEELAEKEKSITLRENRADGIEKLSELKIPTKFVEFVLDTSKEKMDERIKLLSDEWSKAISEEVARQTKGEPPKDPANGTDNSKANAEFKPRTAW